VYAALQESVDVIGLSILSGGQVLLLTRIMELLKENSMDDVLVTAGGIIPKEDRDILKALGVSKVFGPGSLSKEIVQFLKEAIAKRHFKS
jgi:methylmalonyl-CoA mutase C-terminal domain/subunit